MNFIPHPALTSNSPTPSSLRKSHISQRPAGRLARRAITKVLLVSAKPVKYKESSAWGKGNGLQLQLEAGKGGDEVSDPLFSIGFCSGINFYFRFLFFIAGHPENIRRNLSQKTGELKKKKKKGLGSEGCQAAEYREQEHLRDCQGDARYWNAKDSVG